MNSIKRTDGLKIMRVHPGSKAERSGIREGDFLLRINGRLIEDPIDYRFFESEEDVVIEIERETAHHRMALTKEMDEDLGLELKEPRYRTCRNHCMFCFVRQMPKGLRRSLYVKDDDYRLSFMHGNYITLTNLTQSDFERIFQQRLSPLYVSVHATEDAVRRRILGNPEAPSILPAMKRLISGGIRLHTQIVLCPGVNDGAVLDHTAGELMDLWPGVSSAAVVPVGLTRHRENLEPLQGIDPHYAGWVLNQVEAFQKICIRRFSEPWIFASDEFYLTAGRSFPPVKRYGELPQVENGVGMTPLFVQQVEKALNRLPKDQAGRRYVIGTGVSAYPVLHRLIQRIMDQTGCRVDLVRIRNRFFGDSVTVSGLLTGSDLMDAFLKHTHTGGPIILPNSMLRLKKRTFLDGMNIRDVEKQIGWRLRFVESSAEGFLSPFLKVRIP
ncbi:MAG: DUF512 domain-containing protein [Nitrospirae bacterium CG08_land_8_20_14_0_20_52_24]|nr:MAG: hypothetical protein AUK29_01050 [Nitrospirae bacterium CG2_30_53_67]PIS37381.1 MAG: DUF512 domain-containing protein [Nitrospirae bacterium CG08_land_8_20_14_0_20_52_24]PIV82765.1 MAG: DUF512 domain-containing protein [Nitrospirae bacterium CG17_big_fil_post_rev_8_21_14_2_50_50_9]PIW85394.1 MAG: DUF512 domain-containing protein [Nitrospirae bacterium CG_4_8_14_3_um_filter_50_41]PIX85332.1 MAG: DUF512 domain-containing protein [Nitrospirae bacterium CG_4_10_14_3_um_filter_53_41]